MQNLIKQIRTYLNISQTELAEQLNVTFTTVNRWENGRLYLTQRNRFFAGDTLEIVSPGQPPVTVTAQGLQNEDGESIETANHAMMQCSICCDQAFPARSVVRKPVE